MKTFFKILGALLLLVLLGIAGLIFTFDPNNYKDQITQQVEQQTRRNFTIEGDINLSIIPWIGLELGKVALGNAQGFSRANFAEISQLDIKVMFWPLLIYQEVQVDKVRLHGLSVSLEVNNQGVNNWQDLSQQTSKDTVKTGKPADKPKAIAKAPEKDGAALAGLAVNGLELVGANIQWSDAQTSTKASVSDLNLETGAIRFNEPVAIDFSTKVKSNQPEVDATIALQTNVKFNEALDVFDVNDLALNIKTLMQSVSSQHIMLDVKTDAHVDLGKQIASIKGLGLAVFGIELNGEFSITQLDSEPKIKGGIATNKFNARKVASQLGIELPPMVNANSLSRVSLKTNVDATPGSVDLDKFSIGLDKTTIDGWIHVLDIAQPNVQYNLKMSPIDVDDYMPPPVEEEKEMFAAKSGEKQSRRRGAQAEAADIEIPLPVDLLRELRLKGNFDMEKVTVQKIDITDINIKTQAGSGLVRVKPVSMKLLKGQMEMGLDLDVNQIPAYTMALSGDDLHAGPVVNPMLKGVMGDEKIKLKGAARLSADVRTQGTSLMTLKKAATGKVSFDMDQTEVTGVDIEYFARNAIVDYLEEKKLDVPADWRGQYSPKETTAFRKIHASGVINQGKLKNNDFIMDSKRIKVTGKGEVDIVENTMDYNAIVDLNIENKKTFAEKVLDEPLGVHIHGPFEQLAIDPDKQRIGKVVKNLLAEKAKKEVKKKIDAKKKQLDSKVDKKTEETKQKLEDKLRNKLKGLF